jgi:cytoskeletal protein CcmA (bactofilin family)
MNNQKINKMKILFSAIVFISLVLVPLQVASAQSPVYGNNVPAGQTIEDSLLLYGPQVSIDGVVDGDVLAIGQDVTVNGEVKGSLVAVGSKVLINGKIDGNVYSAAGSIEMGPTSVTHWSLYFVGGFLTLNQGSQIERDVYTMSLGARMMGTIGRNTRAFIGLSEILRLLLVDTGLMQSLQSRFQSAPAPAPTPTTLANSGLSAQGAELASLAPLSLLRSKANSIMTSGIAVEAISLQQPTASGGLDASAVGNWLYNRFHDILPLLIIGLILAWLFPRFLKGSAKSLRSSPLADIGLGLLAYIVGYGATALLLVLVIAIGVFFVAIKFWGLAWLTWGVGLSSIGLAFWIFSLAVGYLSKIIVSFLVGELILGRLADTVWRRLGSVVLGLIIFVLVASIPILGWVITFLVILFGLGAIVSYLLERRRAPMQPQVSEENLPTAQPQAPEEMPSNLQPGRTEEESELVQTSTSEETTMPPEPDILDGGSASSPPEIIDEASALSEPEMPEGGLGSSQPEDRDELTSSQEPDLPEESPPTE